MGTEHLPWPEFPRRMWLLAGLIWLTGCEIATIRPLNPVTGKAVIDTEASVFDPDAYAAKVWTTDLPEAVSERSGDLSSLLAALEEDAAAAAQAFGHGEPGRPPSFLVHGTGTITSVDTASRAGLVEVDLDPMDGIVDLQLQVGPVIRGTALRDALPFIAFNAFENQLEYAAVSRALHRIVVDSVLAGFERGALSGAAVSFFGAFTYSESGPILVTPVRMRIER